MIKLQNLSQRKAFGEQITEKSMIKNLSLLLFLATASSYAMSYEQSSVQEVEERPSLGFYLEYGTPDSYEITYIEQNNNGVDQSGGESNGVIYENKTLDVTPTIGFAGHIPFIWDKYLDATATVGGSQTKITAKTNKTLDPDSNEIKLARRTRIHETFNVIIEGGPELGFPLYLDYKSQQIIKPFVQVRAYLSKHLTHLANHIGKMTKPLAGVMLVGFAGLSIRFLLEQAFVQNTSSGNLAMTRWLVM